MADLVANTAIAFECQSAPASYETLDSTDRYSVANVTVTPRPITADDPRYLGSIHRPGAIRLGVIYDVSFDILLHGYSGTTPPSAGAFLPGRVLRSLGMTEQVIAATIPSGGPEAVAAGTTGSITLGAGATGTLDLYKALAVQLEDAGVGDASLIMMSEYSAAKVAQLAQTLGGTPEGNYMIPKQLAYTMAGSGTPPLLSIDVWQGGIKRQFGDMAPSAATLTFNTAGRDGGQNFSVLSVTYTGDLIAESDNAAPVVAPTIAIPPFKGGKLHVGGIAMGGASLSLDFGLRTGFPPNPNKASGSDAAQLVETRRTLTLNLNQTALSYNDIRALAVAQGVHPIQLLYGLAPGNYIGFVATAARFMDPSPQAGGDFYTQQIQAFVDGADKTIGLCFVAHSLSDIGS